MWKGIYKRTMLMATYGISFKESKYGWMIGSDKVEW